MPPKSTALHADNCGYKLSLLRVAPGREPAVARQLTSSIRRHSQTEPVCVLKLFGRFDICAIYRTNDYLDGPSRFGPIDGIRGGNKINAFHWLASSESPGLTVEHAPGNVWAISFCRLNEPVVRLFGGNVEAAVAEVSHGYLGKGIAVDVLGTTGWAELVVLIRCQTFSQVADALSRNSQGVVRYELGRQRNQEPLTAKTFSLLGVSFNLTHGPRFRERLRVRLGERFVPGKKVYPSVSVTCPPAAMASIHAAGNRLFGPGSVTFGAADLSFWPSSSTWGKLIGNLLALRRKFDGNIYSTSISVLHVGYRQEKVKSRPPTRRGLRMPDLNSAPFLRWGPTLEHRLRTLYLGLSNLLQDPLIGDCFEDLRLMAEDRLPKLLLSLSPRSDDQSRLVLEFAEVLAYATEERYHGAFLSLEHLSDLSPTKGGIQRIIAAASCVPRKLLSRVNKTWYGFVVAGYHNEFFSSHFEALNLPFEYLFRPEEWCGLFHEIGHAAFFDTSFYNMDGAEIARIIKELVPKGPADVKEYSKWMELSWEIGADMFDLYFCYGLDLGFYLKNIWPFLKQKRKRVTTEHFHRYFLVYQFWKYILKGGETRFPSNVSVGADIVEFIEYLTQLGLISSRNSIDTESRENAATAFSVLSKAIEVFARLFRRNAPPRDLAAELSRPNMQKALDSVGKGIPWFGAIDAPDTFILGLRKRNQLTLSARLAAIISLWNSAVQFAPRA